MKRSGSQPFKTQTNVFCTEWLSPSVFVQVTQSNQHLEKAVIGQWTLSGRGIDSSSSFKPAGEKKGKELYSFTTYINIILEKYGTLCQILL